MEDQFLLELALIQLPSSANTPRHNDHLPFLSLSIFFLSVCMYRENLLNLPENMSAGWRKPSLQRVRRLLAASAVR